MMEKIVQKNYGKTSTKEEYNEISLDSLQEI
jgi:hypothetical protein